MKRASIYERNDKWYFQPDSQTVTGLWIATPPFLEIDRRDSPRCKYEAAVQVLQASRDGLPVPGDNEDLLGPLLRMANARSWSEFAKKAKYISLAFENDQFVITPYRKMKQYKAALEPVPEEAMGVQADASPDEIARALEEAMSRSQ